MKSLLVTTSIFFISLLSVAQNTADFSLLDDRDRILCYTEKANGTPLKSTSVTFTNSSTCSGNCVYAWDFGDNSAQQIAKDLSDGKHDFVYDGLYEVSLSNVNTASINDTIKNKNITAVQYLYTNNDSVDLNISYKGADNIEKTALVRIPSNEFSQQYLPDPIEVYSPVVSDLNFEYKIDEPDSEEQLAAIQSFVHIFNVDTVNFKPHKKNMWKYYWEIQGTDSDGIPDILVTEFVTDSLEYRYTFPLESFDPGYYVQLKIALDSSKFDNTKTIEYHNLENCVASQSQIIPVKDYFYTDPTQTEEKIKNRIANIPNVFTPGGGDENDVFYFNTNGIDLFTIHIYNSWGGLVYKQDANTISWTGRDNSGEECPSGTYYYVISSNNLDNRHETAGFIHLFRQN